MKQIQIIGHLGKDAEVKRFGETDYTSFSVAVTEKIKGEDVTTWFDCLKYGTNDNLRPLLVKGKQVFIQGSLNAKISESNGKTYLNLSINVDKVQLVGAKIESQQHTTATSKDYQPPVAPNEGSDLPFN